MKKTRHGYSPAGNLSRVYVIWAGMRRRCNTPSSSAYYLYGARGIRVCAAWDDFRQFLADMGEPPEGMSIDRIDVNGNYEPSNCRWATSAQQARNTRSTVYVVVNGERRARRDVEEELGLTPGAIWHRLKNGWPMEKALSTPSLNKGTTP